VYSENWTVWPRVQWAWTVCLVSYLYVPLIRVICKFVLVDRVEEKREWGLVNVSDLYTESATEIINHQHRNYKRCGLLYVHIILDEFQRKSWKLVLFSTCPSSVWLLTNQTVVMETCHIVCLWAFWQVRVGYVSLFRWVSKISLAWYRGQWRSQG